MRGWEQWGSGGMSEQWGKAPSQCTGHPATHTYKLPTHTPARKQTQHMLQGKAQAAWEPRVISRLSVTSTLRSTPAMHRG